MDEFANADGAELFRMPVCLVNFRVNDRGEFELDDDTGLGENTIDFVMEQCYPTLKEVLGLAESDERGDYTPAALEAIRNAVKHERLRQWKQSRDVEAAETEHGKELQKEMDLPKVVADRIVPDKAKRILESDEGSKGKLQ